MTKTVNQIFEDFLDNITLSDVNKRKTAQDVLPDTSYASAFELLENYDFFVAIRAQIFKPNSNEWSKVARTYLDEILTMNRMVDEYEVGVIYMADGMFGSGIEPEKENGVEWMTKEVAQITGASQITKEDRIYVCIGMNLKNPQVRNILRLLHSLDLRNINTKNPRFIMNELTIIPSHHTRQLPTEDYIIRFLSCSHIRDFLNDKYSDTGDHFFQRICFRDVLRAVFIMAPERKQQSFATICAMRPQSYEYTMKHTALDAANAYIQKICTSMIHQREKSNKKVALKKSVMDILTQTKLTGTYVHETLIYWVGLENAAEWNIEYVDKAHTSVGKKFAEFIQSGEAYAKYVEMRAIKSTADLAILCLYLEPQFIHDRYYLGVVVMPGAETDFYYSFHQYAEELKKCFDDKLDDIYMTNAIAKALK